MRAVVGDEGVGLFEPWTVDRQSAISVKRSALDPQGEQIGEFLLEPDVYHSQAREISILCAERAIENVHVVDQFWRQALERSQIALAVSLRALILL